VGLVHVLSEHIVPDARYKVEAFGCSPGRSVADDASALALIVDTARWGDLVGDCSVTPCTPPDGKVDFIDISAIVGKFQDSEWAPIKARADVAPEVPDRVIDFSDIMYVVDAFRGQPYPFSEPQ
jgi:hypothetical protein